MPLKDIISSYRSLNPFVKILIWSLTLLAAYSLFGFYGVPRIVRYVLVQKVPESLHRPVQVQDVSFNPFKLELKIKGLEIGSKVKGKSLLSLQDMDVDLEAVSLFKMALVVSRLTVDSPSFYLERDKKGVISIEDLITGTDKKTESEEEKKEGSFKFSINNIEIKNGRLIFEDRLKASVHRVEKMDIGIPFISNMDQKVRIYVKPYFSAVINGSPVGFKGRTRPFARDMDTIIDLRFANVDIPRYLRYMPNVLGLRLKRARLDTDLSIHFTQKKNPTIILSGNATISRALVDKKGRQLLGLNTLQVRIKPSRLFSRHFVLEATLKDLKLNALEGNIASKEEAKKASNGKDDKNILFIPEVDVNGIDIDLAKDEIGVQDIQVLGPDARIRIDKNGKSNLERVYSFLISNADDMKSKAQKAKSAQGEKKGKESIFRLGIFRITNGTVRFSDFSAVSPVSLRFSKLDTELKDFSTLKGSRFAFAFQTSVNKSGMVKLSGSGQLSQPEVGVDITASNVPLPPFQGYVSKFVNLEIGRGHVSLKSQASFSLKGDKLLFSAKGNSKIQNVLIFGKRTQEPFTKWKEISINNFSIGYAPLKVVVDEIVLKGLKQNIIVFKDGTTNVASIIRSEKGQGSRASERPGSNKASRMATGSKGGSNPFVKIGKVRFGSCRIRIVDRSLKQVFVREFDQINGSISGLESRPGMKAKVDISALVDNRSKASVSGLISPLAKPLFADITVKIGGAGMTRFSPYAQRFLGYQIEKGKMFLDLHIKLQGTKLYVDNRLLLDQFDLGNRVQSKDAINAPIKLAIALLKDRSGKIDLDIPVRGELDDPEFSYRGAVLRAIMNIFVKAATAPFSLLGAVLGSDESLDSVPFEPGSAKIDQAIKKKLDLLSKALQDRPALKVEITGYFDPATDKQGLKEKKFQHLLKKEKFRDLSNKEREEIENIDDIQIGPDEYEKYLEKAYKHASFKRPRNFIGMIKSQPKEVMEKMLREHINVTEADLKILAGDRAKAVANYLIRQGKIAQDRVFLVAPNGKAGKGKAAFSGVRLTLR